MGICVRTVAAIADSFFPSFYLSFLGYKNVMCKRKCASVCSFRCSASGSAIPLLFNVRTIRGTTLQNSMNIRNAPKLTSDTSYGMWKIRCEKPRVARLQPTIHLISEHIMAIKMSVRVRLVLTLKTNLIFAILQINQNTVNVPRVKKSNEIKADDGSHFAALILLNSSPPEECQLWKMEIFDRIFSYVVPRHYV